MESRRKITLNWKQGYLTPKIKTTDWECFPLSRPIDNDPFCPEKYNLQTSHYNRLGTEKADWTTVTKEMSKHIFDKKRREMDINPYKTLVNVYTPIEPEEPKQECNPLHRVDYSTTMQSHYTLPFRTPLKGTIIPEPCFLLNRRFAYQSKKFLDDDYLDCLKKMQCHKVQRHVSYNPMTGKYTDGTPGYINKNKCIDFQKVIENYKI